MMDDLVAAAKKHYRDLLDHPKFIEFYSQATPIDVLEHSKIGSRPARRTGQRSLSDLRSIPWVFSWNQARFNLTGWYGAGSAFQKLLSERPKDFELLKQLAKEWPFFKYLVIQIETNLLLSDKDIMKAFAALVQNADTQKELLNLIINDFDACLASIGKILGADVTTRRVTRIKDIGLRNDGLKALHKMQIDTIVKWRAIHTNHPEKNEMYLLELLLLVNAISGGLKSTG
jgi:phosphoenolpyruvate carboxylase